MTDTTSTGNPAVTVPAATYTGATAHMVRIRAEYAGDEPGVRLVGLPPEHVWTTRDRLRAALTNSGLTYPSGPLTLAVFPHALQVGDSGLDLAFALALLAATGQLPTDRVTALAGLGELGLDGSLRPVPGLTDRARAVAAAAIPNTVVAAADLPAAVPILGGSVQAASSLADLVAALRGGTPLQRPAAWPVAPTLAGTDLAQAAAAHPNAARQPGTRRDHRGGAVMTTLDEIRAARATLAGPALAGNLEVLAALAAHGPVDALGHLADRAEDGDQPRTLPAWTSGELVRGHAVTVARQAAHAGARLVIPEDDEWPTTLPDLATAPPGQPGGGVLCLWVHGDPPVSTALQRAVAVVGARAATPYGTHVAEQLGYDLASAGWTVVSTGAYGVEGAAARGALSGGGTVVAVLPAGVDRPYPCGHANLFDQIAARGLLVSPWPPGITPTRTQFPVTSRLVATMAAGTVLVEATTRSMSLRALDQALTLGRPGMVVPGPVTSALSAGPLQALRTHRHVRLVRGAADVIAELVSPAEDTD